jgi:streptogramin lyase
VGHAPSALAVDKSSVWVANSDDGTVTRIDPSLRAVVGSPITAGSEPSSVVLGGGSIWVGNELGATVTQIELNP